MSLLLLLSLLSLLSLVLSTLSEPLEATEVEAGFTAGPEGFAPGAQVADAGTSVTPTPPHSFLANWAETVSVSFARAYLGLQLGEGEGEDEGLLLTSLVSHFLEIQQERSRR